MCPTTIKEIPFKAWKMDEAERLRISPKAFEERLRRNQVPKPELRKVNKRVMFVVLQGQA